MCGVLTYWAWQEWNNQPTYVLRLCTLSIANRLPTRSAKTMEHFEQTSINHSLGGSNNANNEK